MSWRPARTPAPRAGDETSPWLYDDGASASRRRGDRAAATTRYETERDRRPRGVDRRPVQAGPALRLDAGGIRRRAAAASPTSASSSRQLGHVGVDGFGIAAAQRHRRALHPRTTAPRSRSSAGCRELATGELVGAIAMTEPGAGSDLQGVKTAAERDGDQYGSTAQDLHHQRPDRQPDLVVAKTDPAQGAKGISLLVVETDDADGLRARPQARQDRPEVRSDTSELFFDDVRVPTDNLLGARGRPGLHPADAAAAAGAAAHRARRDRHDRAGAGA